MFKFERGGGVATTRREAIDPRLKRIKERAFAGGFTEEDFIHRPYSAAEVKADQDFVKGKEASKAKIITPEEAEQKEMADIFEAVVILAIKESQWLGVGATATKTAKYDDSYNEVDMLVEFKQGLSAAYLGLATDVTFSSRQDVITKKFASIRDKIKRGILSQIKYFHSDHTHFSGQLSKQPEVVIGVSKRMVLELASLLADGKYEALAEHRAVVMILKQIEAQLNTFEGYAKSIGKLEAAGLYAGRLAIIRQILRDKKALVDKVGKTGEDDPVHQEIMKFAENWNRY